MNERIIESERLKVKLLNGSVITIRPLTLSERKECISLLPKNLNEKSEQFVEDYMQLQIEMTHYIISRENKDFKKSDVAKLLDSSLIEQIVKFTLKDPFANWIV